jgi:hypothetical protein
MEDGINISFTVYSLEFVVYSFLSNAVYLSITWFRPNRPGPIAAVGVSPTPSAVANPDGG